MAKNRKGRINDEFRAALSEALRRVKDPRVSGLVSILRCEVTGDMRWCKVYVSVLGTPEQQKEAIKGLRSAAGWLRREAGQRVDLRYTPELIIVEDNSISHGIHIAQVLDQIMPEEREKEEADDEGEEL